MQRLLYPEGGLQAGADTIEHPLPRSEETIQMMAKKGVAAGPDADPLPNYFRRVGRVFWIHFAAVYVFKGRQPGNVEAAAEGRDQVWSWHGFDLHWYRYMPGAYIRELKNFVEAGWSVPEALVAATKTNSEILDMEDRLGTLQAGKLADVLVVDGKPDENLEDPGQGGFGDSGRL